MGLTEQSPPPGSRLIHHRGDSLRVTVTVPPGQSGKVWLRTNIGQAETRRNEIVSHVEHGEPILERDWHDLEMLRTGEGKFELQLPLLEVGRFRAKTFFEPADGGKPVWTTGDDVVLKVDPAEYCCASTIYSAFVRQFGDNRTNGAEREGDAAVIAELEQAGYEVIPRSGTFRDLVSELDHIIGTLGFRIIQLLPVFPTPTTHARMGRFGSPFAALDFFDVDPALAEFDRKTTPLEQFGELVDETHRRSAKLFLDIPINHTGWASWLQNHHPEWFKRHEDSGFVSPGAWGVTWGDLAELDYRDRELWTYMAEVFLFWCRQGVDGFRCDAGYMVPLPVWEYITAKVRMEFPDAIFLLEGLGGDKRLVFELLDTANLNWAYSELFQNYSRTEVESILTETIRVSGAEGVQVHFAETHDNNRLAASSHNWSRMRTALAALSSHGGGFGTTCGAEWFATEKIEVHHARSLNWGNSEHQIDLIRRLNAILTVHPAFWHGADLNLVQHDAEDVLVLKRDVPDSVDSVLVLINLNIESPAIASWKVEVFPGDRLWDLVTGEQVAQEGATKLELGPGGVRCLTADSAWLNSLDLAVQDHSIEPSRSAAQRCRAKILELMTFFGADTEIPDLNAEWVKPDKIDDPQALCERLAGRGMPPVVRWNWPRDIRRIVPWPGSSVLLIEAEHAFVAEIRNGDTVLRHELSLVNSGSTHFAIVVPPASTNHLEQMSIHLTVFGPDGCRRERGEVLILSDTQTETVTMVAGKATTLRGELYGLCTNGRGAMTQVRGNWGEIRSQYDSLLAANPNDDYPVDRQMLLARLRGWIVHRDYSREINAECLQSFSQAEDGTLRWESFVPAGMGKHVRLDIRLALLPGKNCVDVSFHRQMANGEDGALSDSEPIQLILRPDIEDRNFHHKTKAHHGHDETWPKAVTSKDDAFDFEPSGNSVLRVKAPGGEFVTEPEWQHGVPHPIDAIRGLDGESDLFSPGYFTFSLGGDESAVILASIPGEEPGEEHAVSPTFLEPESLTIKEAAKRAISSFIVKRDDTKTVIAGYPWFLDWGRDTLICLRGIIAAGMLKDARDIVRQFAKFEDQGTLPNMIRGDDDSNRDTSDAPLWLFAACADLRRVEGNDDFLNSDCGNGRTIQEVLSSIAQGYLEGTPNGIQVDADSGLVFSPSHFTWMDTNHPPGTPREGYPIEIQALWHSALTLLNKLDPSGQWNEIRSNVSESILARFWHTERGFLSDCLHAKSGDPASHAMADDHLRPNQLFAITLGAVSDPDICRSVLNASEELLIPGAIRSLADRDVWHRLPVSGTTGLLNDPRHPYWGRYEGDEDTCRKPAYHNGTAWTWPFPSYAEALVMTYGDSALATARAILSSSAVLFNHGCLGHLPEVLDGDAPHTQRGCGAQAWAVTELFRVLALLEAP